MIRSISAFVQTRRLARRLTSRADIIAWQDERRKRLIQKTLPKIPYYRDLAVKEFSDLPIIDKSVLMAHFDQFNRLGLTAEDGWDMFAGRTPQPKGVSVGASTGTSGNRGLYVISKNEREAWLGTILAKALPNFPFETARIALVLPLNSALYTTAARTFGLNLRFFDLHEGIETLVPAIESYGPDTLIAPPKVLLALTTCEARLKPKRLFSSAEVLDPIDRRGIESHFGLIVREIYMATEGLMGVSCERGTLHLCEDVMHFEWETPVAGSDLVAPIITDLTRRTQGMWRYRMNDLLRLSDKPCACGSPYQAVVAIQGRCDDLIEISGQVFTPDILRNAIIDADRRIQDFRLRQTGPATLDLLFSKSLPVEAAKSAAKAVGDLLSNRGVSGVVTIAQEDLPTSAAKLRRVERVWRP